jgi:hypothetical protein
MAIPPLPSAISGLRRKIIQGLILFCKAVLRSVFSGSEPPKSVELVAFLIQQGRMINMQAPKLEIKGLRLLIFKACYPPNTRDKLTLLDSAHLRAVSTECEPERAGGRASRYGAMSSVE